MIINQLPQRLVPLQTPSFMLQIYVGYPISQKPLEGLNVAYCTQYTVPQNYWADHSALVFKNA